MAATATWEQDTGTQTGSPTKGTTRSTPQTNMNYKNSTVFGDLYSDYPITAGNNSYEIATYVKFTSGTFNNINTGLWAHTAGTAGTGCTIKSVPHCTGDGDRWLYTTPTTTANATLTTDATTAVAITSGKTVCFGPTGPEATGKATSATGAADRFTNYLTTQLQTTGSAVPGDNATLTFTLRFNEN